MLGSKQIGSSSLWFVLEFPLLWFLHLQRGLWQASPTDSMLGRKEWGAVHTGSAATLADNR